MPAIKAKYATEEEVPTQHKELFEERQGEWILMKIDGLASEADIHRLTTANTRVRAEKTELEAKVAAFGENTPESITKLNESVDELKAQVDLAAKPNEEKIQALVDTRVKVATGPLQRDLKTSQDALIVQTKLVTDLQGKITKGTIGDAVRGAATKAKVVPTAIEDVLALSDNIFEVLEIEGKKKVVTRDGIGVTPGIDAESYFAEVAPSKPHWFPGSQGAGAGGGKGTVPGLNGDNPWSREFWNVTKQGSIYREQGSDKAEQYAKAAGSTLHATQPPKEKK